MEEMEDVGVLSELVEIDCSASEVSDEVDVSDTIVVGAGVVVYSASELVVRTPVSERVIKSVCVSVIISTTGDVEVDVLVCGQRKAVQG